MVADIEAAAASALDLMARCMREASNPLQLRVDHPFLFTIVTRSNSESIGNICLFLGHLTTRVNVVASTESHDWLMCRITLAAAPDVKCQS